MPRMCTGALSGNRFRTFRFMIPPLPAVPVLAALVVADVCADSKLLVEGLANGRDWPGRADRLDAGSREDRARAPREIRGSPTARPSVIKPGAAPKVNIDAEEPEDGAVAVVKGVRAERGTGTRTRPS